MKPSITIFQPNDNQKSKDSNAWKSIIIQEDDIFKFERLASLTSHLYKWIMIINWVSI